MPIKFRHTSHIESAREKRDPPFGRLPELGMPRRKAGAFTLIALACIIVALGVIRPAQDADAPDAVHRATGSIVRVDAVEADAVLIEVVFTLPDGTEARGSRALPAAQAGHLRPADRIAVLYDPLPEGGARVFDLGRVALPEPVR